jgi:hypothetical protein
MIDVIELILLINGFAIFQNYILNTSWTFSVLISNLQVIHDVICSCPMMFQGPC